MDRESELQARDGVLDLIYTIQREAKLSHWSPAVRAAPEAIQVMAICLRAASNPEACAIEVSQSFVDLEGQKIVFPSKFLGTNLQHCSDLGRAAFREAESGMRKLQLNLEDILGTRGTIRSIVRLLDSPKRAKYQLRGSMDNLRESADDCRKNAEAIKERFERMLNFTMALQKATEDKQGITSAEQGHNSRRTVEERHNVEAYQAELKELKEQLKKEAAHLDDARKTVKQAEEDVDHANAEALKPTENISLTDIQKFVEMSNPALKAKDPGLFRKVGRFFGGASEKENRVEQTQQKELNAAREKQRKELLEERQKTIEANQAHALKALELARLTATERQQSLDETSKKHRSISERLLASSKSLENANLILDQLGHEKVDLAKTKEIIDTSIQSLTTFKHQVDAMLDYFKENAEVVAKMTAKNGPLGKILQTIEGISEASGNTKGAKVMKNLEIDPEDKEDYLQHALQLEGRFSIVYGIAGVYLAVSKNYIIPGINQMEQLAILPNREYSQQIGEFKQWVIDAKAGIEAMSSKREEAEVVKKMGQQVWLMAGNTKLITGNTPFPEADEIDDENDDDSSIEMEKQHY